MLFVRCLLCGDNGLPWYLVRGLLFYLCCLLFDACCLLFVVNLLARLLCVVCFRCLVWVAWHSSSNVRCLLLACLFVNC